MVVPYRLQAGDAAPRQQSPTTCGSASLTVARMLVNPAFARWIGSGRGKGTLEGDVPDPRTPAQRFAAYEQVVASRTNAVLRPGGRIQLPWPRALGTPPWGAGRELELGAADPEVDYEVHWVRLGSRARLEREYADLSARVGLGRPVLLYVGNGRLPRHVVLVMPATRSVHLDVYEPSIGRVLGLSERAFTTRRLALAGWDVPWAVVRPRSTQPVSPGGWGRLRRRPARRASP